MLTQATQALEPLMPDSVVVRAEAGTHKLNIMVRGETVGSYRARVIDHLTKERAGQELAQGQDPDGTVLIARRVTSKAQELLRKNKQLYLDSGGNCYLESADDASPLIIFISGQSTNVHRDDLPNRAFQKAGLKLIFAALTRDDLINAPYRTIAEEAGISRGAVGYILSDLQELGYVVKIDARARKLRRHRELVDRWAVAYAERLRPKLIRGRFQLLDDRTARDWASIGLNADLGYWGGEAGADALTNDVRPESLCIYTEQPTPTLLQALRMVPNPEGTVEVIDRFWQPSALRNEVQYPPTAPPLLIYADLLALGESRATNIANRIRTEYLTDG